MEYEWRDITERNGASCVICPVCGRSISVPETIKTNSQINLSGYTITDKLEPHSLYGIQSVPYDIFERSGVYASSNKTDCSSHVSALSTSVTEAKTDDVCTLTATI